MMKAFFYFPINVDLAPDSGVIKKNNHILSSAAKLGVKADVISFSNRGIHFNNSLIDRIPQIKLSKALYYYLLAYHSVLKTVDFSNYEFAWIRAGLCLPPFFEFIKSIKKKNPDLKIILEYGSYPFRDELSKLQKALFPISEFYSQYLKNYVSYVITYCGQSEIYGIPNIKIGNGIDVDLIEWESSPTPFDNELRLISVSSMLYWHAYDRVIRGIKNYYDTRSKEDFIKIQFHIVGSGSETEKLERLTRGLNLTSNVIFHKHKTGKELNDVFNQCHLAIGTLGMHRKNLLADSSLKNREYFSRGMPFVLSTIDADFPADLPFVKYVPADESPININSLIDFFQNMSKNYHDFPTLIRNYAENNLTWKAKLEKVLRTINSQG